MTILSNRGIYRKEISGPRNEILSSLNDDSNEFLSTSNSCDENDNSTDYDGTLDQIVDNDFYDEQKVTTI